MFQKKILVYGLLLTAIFFCLFFIMGQNQQYKEIKQMESSLYKKIRTELASYHEQLYQIEQNTKLTFSSQGRERLEVGTTVVNLSLQNSRESRL